MAIKSANTQRVESDREKNERSRLFVTFFKITERNTNKKRREPSPFLFNSNWDEKSDEWACNGPSWPIEIQLCVWLMKKGKQKIIFSFSSVFAYNAPWCGHRVLVCNDHCSLSELCIKRATRKKNSPYLLFIRHIHLKLNNGKPDDWEKTRRRAHKMNTPNEVKSKLKQEMHIKLIQASIVIVTCLFLLSSFPLVHMARARASLFEMCAYSHRSSFGFKWITVSYGWKTLEYHL